jgi:hypothetical protein
MEMEMEMEMEMGMEMEMEVRWRWMEMETETGRMRVVERVPELDGKFLKLYVRYIDLSMLGYLIVFSATKLK